MVAAPFMSWPCHRFKGWMSFRSTLPRIQCIRLALVASALLLIGLCYPRSSDIEDLTSMSEPVSFTQFICCNCHDTDPARIATTFFSTRRAVELHISRSKVCKAAGKGVRSVPVVYRESRRVEDHEAGPIGAPGPWPVRRAGDGGEVGEISSPISQKRYRYRKFPISVYCDIANTSGMTSAFFAADIRISRYFWQYRDHIGLDIGEKTDIGFGKERVCPDIDPISVPISGKNPISGPILVISGLARNGYVPILYRYQ
jgi:hypothetical protein